MDFFAISALINAVTSTTLGSIVLARDIRNKIYVLFSLFAFAVAAWSTLYLLWLLSDSAQTALFYIKSFMLAAVWIPFIYFHFVTVFIQKNKKFFPITIVGYLAAIIFSLLSFTNFFIAGLKAIDSFKYWPQPGIAFHFFLLVWLVYIILATALLFSTYMNTHEGHHRQQIFLLLIGMSIGYMGGITNYFLWYDIPIAPYGNILVSVYVILVTYAIIRHHLFSIKVIVAELVVLILWITTLVRLTLSENFKDTMINSSYLIATILIGTFLIISVRKEVKEREKSADLAKRLAKANSKLKALDKQKSEFVSIASHQLRSPLTAIRGYASLLLEESFGTLPQKAVEPLQRIDESSKLMALAIEDYLNVSRIESGNMKYNLSDFNLAKETEHVTDDLRSDALKKGLVLYFRNHLHSNGMIHADIGKIVQIIHNLINNAIKYTTEGTINVLVRDDMNKNKIFVDIIDTGIGMNDETLHNIFQKFERAKNANSVNTSGTGLGLFVADKMAEAMGGDITAHSDGDGKGSRFTLEMPLAM